LGPGRDAALPLGKQASQKLVLALQRLVFGFQSFNLLLEFPNGIGFSGEAVALQQNQSTREEQEQAMRFHNPLFRL
jgi:hypothetical protein